MVFWALGLIVHIGGGLIHLLLVLAMETLLRLQGCEVATATNGASAIQLLSKPVYPTLLFNLIALGLSMKSE